MTNINRREAATLINALTAGVVPRIGLRHVAVGRQPEVNAFLRDLQTIQEEGAAFRFVCGPYGSGKSFLIQMIRNNALERGVVVMDADLSPERRLTGSQGQGLATYRELLQHLTTQTRPEGGALESILQKWIRSIQEKVEKEKSTKDPDFTEAVRRKMAGDLAELSEMSFGFAFSIVLDAYWQGWRTEDEKLCQAAMRWLRGEYANKTEAKKELPVDCIIDDASWYEFLKLFALFVKKAGYLGLTIFLDEGVNLYKINHKQSRESNYEKLLTIFNDTMQGKCRYLGFFMSGTPQFVYDERRGLFSYEALRSRLAANRFSAGRYVDLTGPVIGLSQLTPEEIFLLLERLCHLHAMHYEYESTIGPKQIQSFLEMTLSRLGADKLLTPREVTRDFLGLLNILQQNPNVQFEDLIQDISVSVPSQEEVEEDSFAEFEI